MKFQFSFMVIFLYLTVLVSCKKKENVVISTYTPEEWRFKTPKGFPEPNYKFENNEQSQLRFELGRFLFHDPILSSNNKISCSSCHAQPHGFADHNVSVSTGVNGLKGHRNAPALINLAWNTSFMWDGGVNHIEVQPLVPLTSPHELNETLENIVAKLNASSFYKQKFKEAYDIDVITGQKTLQALTQFTAMLTSSDTKYDQYIVGKIDFTANEKAGLQLFRQNCTSCHREPLFTDFSYRNIGLDIVSEDIGRELITQNPLDKGKFKVPTLRNIELTYPYMHDGRFQNLTQLLNHHTNNAIITSLTDNYIKNATFFTEAEKSDLIEFLKTLTDYSMIGKVMYSEPVR